MAEEDFAGQLARAGLVEPSALKFVPVKQYERSSQKLKED